MRVPVIQGVIDRRILVNYRVDPAILAEQLPAPFRPQRVHGFGMAGICLIRLAGIRPVWLPRWLGIGSENAAHRTAVEWDEAGETRRGVFIRRRDTTSWLNALAGGRLFPGEHHHARFQVREDATRLSVEMQGKELSLAVAGRITDRVPATSVFESLAEASAFFQGGSLGYSVTRDPARFDGLELRCREWKMEPLEIEQVRSSVFEDPRLFPAGSIEFDSAFAMRGIEHEWHGQPDLCCPAAAEQACR